MDSHETPLTVTTTSTTDPSLALCDEKISLVVYHWINFVVITIIAIIGEHLDISTIWLRLQLRQNFALSLQAGRGTAVALVPVLGLQWALH